MAKKTRTKKLIIGNWKMNPENLLQAKEIFLGIRKTARDLTRVQTVMCPPFVYISELNKLFHRERIALGAQDSFYEDTGSFTGQISPIMLKNVGATYVIIGHSERRALGETNELINKKVTKALRDGFRVVLCIGEKDRDSHGAYLEFLKTQLKECLAKLQKKDIEKLVIAYEPIWAIGKTDKEAMQPPQIYEMTIFIKKVLTDMFGNETAVAVPLLYGGSVSSKISNQILVEGQVNGLLVGKQSLNPEDFSLILKNANEI